MGGGIPLQPQDSLLEWRVGEIIEDGCKGVRGLGELMQWMMIVGWVPGNKDGGGAGVGWGVGRV